MKQRAEFWFVGKDQTGKCSLLAPGVVAIAAAATTTAAALAATLAALAFTAAVLAPTTLATTITK